jgi:hypothetical protein
MGLNLGEFRDMPTAEFKARSDDAWKTVAADMLASLKMPVLCTDENCADDAKVHIMFVRHGDGNNCKLVSPDGNPAKILRAPLLNKKRNPIANLHHSQIEWRPEKPERLGFEILFFSGWWAKRLELCRVRSPELSSLVQWTDEQRHAWEVMRRYWIHTQPKNRPLAMFTRNEAS